MILWLKRILGIHIHDWKALNDVSELSVPQTYPPDTCIYDTPKRRCQSCGKVEEFVGPEICGGNSPRWVPYFRLTQDQMDAIDRECGFPN